MLAEDKTTTTCNSDDEKKRICQSCSKEYHSGNFCTGCGKKMVDECDCWKLNCRLNCGYSKCPTTKALVEKFG